MKKAAELGRGFMESRPFATSGVSKISVLFVVSFQLDAALLAHKPVAKLLIIYLN